MKAVHFGAGNIGRGFVGLLLHEAGYELVFSDVSAALVDAINAEKNYTVHEVGAEPCLERLDPAAERGLRDVARAGGCRKITRRDQFDEVFDPGEFHRTASCVFCMMHA